MNKAKAPRSLRSIASNSVGENDNYSGSRVSAVAGLIAVASFSGAEAQTNLPPVTVDAPVARPRPAATIRANTSRHWSPTPCQAAVSGRDELPQRSRFADHRCELGPPPTSACKTSMHAVLPTASRRQRTI